MIVFFFNDTATTEIYTLSLHDALPILAGRAASPAHTFCIGEKDFLVDGRPMQIRCGELHFARVPREYWRQRLQLCRDRKSTRLNSSHQIISYAVFCLKKKYDQLLPSPL